MGFLQDTPRNHLIAFLAEFAGTFLFLFFSFTIAQVALTPPTEEGVAAPQILVIMFIALGFASSLAINVWLFYRVSGGMFNPAVSLRTPITRSMSTDSTARSLSLSGLSAQYLPYVAWW